MVCGNVVYNCFGMPRSCFTSWIRIGYAVTFACLDYNNDAKNKLQSVEVRRFDGVHWEEFIENQGKDIQGMSTE